MSRRIYAIAGRNGNIVLTDSKQNENGNGTMYKFADPNGDTQLVAIKALNKVLKGIPTPSQQKLEQPVVFLLPRFLEFLRYEDTRKVWVSTGCKKNGSEISPELLEQVKLLDTLVASLDTNLQLFGQQGLKSYAFRYHATKTWNILNQLVPPAVNDTADVKAGA